MLTMAFCLPVVRILSMGAPVCRQAAVISYREQLDRTCREFGKCVKLRCSPPYLPIPAAETT